jgi:hypothetical protein
MGLLNYPTEACNNCGGDTWWYSATEPDYRGPATWICGVCHPPATEAGKLIMRIIKGTYLLNMHRYELEPAQLDQHIATIKELWGKLAALSTGEPACLYIENKKKLKRCVPSIHHEPGPQLECFACKNNYWWEVELMDARAKEDAAEKAKEAKNVAL